MREVLVNEGSFGQRKRDTEDPLASARKGSCECRAVAHEESPSLSLRSNKAKMLAPRVFVTGERPTFGTWADSVLG